jgi:hypothetical protein
MTNQERLAEIMARHSYGSHEHRNHCEVCPMIFRVKQLEVKNKRLREALEHYASDPRRFVGNSMAIGDIAKQALEEEIE